VRTRRADLSSYTRAGARPVPPRSGPGAAIWATYALPLPLLVTAITALWGTRTIAQATGAPTPVNLAWITIALTVIGFVLSLF